MDNQSNPANRPQVSVVIPCFNTGRPLLDALKSVIDQEGSFTLREVLIVDDNSTDPVTREVLNEAEQFPIVRILKNTRKKGPAGARNLGSIEAKGNWLAFLDSDDLWLQDSLAARFSALNFFPDASFISGDFQIWDSDTGEVESNFFRTRQRTSIYYEPAYQRNSPVQLSKPYRETLFTALCHSCSVVVKRETFIEAGGFEETLMYKEDHHLWFKLSKITNLILVPKSVFYYRQHIGNMTKRECSPFEYEKVMLDFVQQSEKLPALQDEINERYIKGFASDAQWFRSKGQFISALNACFKGMAIVRTDIRLWRQLLASILRVR